MKTKMNFRVNVNWSMNLNQFSFSKYDNEEYGSYKGYPCGDNFIITECNLISDIPLYAQQMELISDALESYFNENAGLKFKVDITLLYNNYGSIFLKWKTDRKNFDKVIEENERLVDNFYENDKLEELVNKFSYMNDIYEYCSSFDCDDDGEMRAYIQLHEDLGYTYDADEMASDLNIDIDVVNNFLEIINDAEKYTL